jgi:hypothetical protein
MKGEITSQIVRSVRDFLKKRSIENGKEGREIERVLLYT